MSRSITALALALGLSAGLITTGGAPASAKTYTKVVETYIVKSRGGDIFVEVARPVDGSKMVKAPAILTYSPYSVLYAGDRTRGYDDYIADGYARVFADVIGTGNSGGCWDYGGEMEKKSAYDLVEWIAKQKWSTGKVGMTGGSYNGTTANMAAVAQPPHLTTIVPEAAISRWYGYAYSGGIRYFMTNEMIGPEGPGAITDEGFDTPALFDLGLAIPPPIDAHEPTWAARVQSTIVPCEEVEHLTKSYGDDTPDYDAFWKERDYLRHASKVTIPVLVAANWGDWNVKQEESWNWYNALKNSEKRVLYMGTRWEGHGSPSAAHYPKAVRAWFDHYLMGVDNGAENMPTIVTQTSDYEGAGEWFSYDNKKQMKIKNLELIAQQYPETQPGDYKWQLRPEKPNTAALSLGGILPASWPSAGGNTESHAAHHCRSNHDWWCFESPVLTKDLRIFGPIKVKIWSHADRTWITHTPSIIDVDPTLHTTVVNNHVCAAGDPSNPTACVRALVAVTRGWLDSRYRSGLGKPVDVTPMKSFKMTVVTKPQDYTFKKGHVIMINYQTEIDEWSIPKPYPGCDRAATGAVDKTCPNVSLDWGDGQARLVFPVVDAHPSMEMYFSAGSHQH